VYVCVCVCVCAMYACLRRGIMYVCMYISMCVYMRVVEGGGEALYYYYNRSMVRVLHVSANLVVVAVVNVSPSLLAPI